MACEILIGLIGVLTNIQLIKMKVLNWPWIIVPLALAADAVSGWMYSLSSVNTFETTELCPKVSMCN